MVWKDTHGKRLGNAENVKQYLASKRVRLRFAMNGGMFFPDHSPVGLYIENGVERHPINRNVGSGNFSMKPNGIFGLSKNGAPFITRTSDYKTRAEIAYATQSGPMLVIDGEINPLFNPTSMNLNIRNGVCVLGRQNRLGSMVFAQSKTKINFYNFAAYFKQIGCIRALYLDGFVSRMYAPEQGWDQRDGDFGVMIIATQR